MLITQGIMLFLEKITLLPKIIHCRSFHESFPNNNLIIHLPLSIPPFFFLSSSAWILLENETKSEGESKDDDQSMVGDQVAKLCWPDDGREHWVQICSQRVNWWSWRPRRCPWKRPAVLCALGQRPVPSSLLWTLDRLPSTSSTHHLTITACSLSSNCYLNLSTNTSLTSTCSQASFPPIWAPRVGD